MKKILGFSLVELMISLIVISVVTAAFAPVLTKRLKISDQSIGTATSVSITSNAVCSSVQKGCAECENDKCLAADYNSGYFLNASNVAQMCNSVITGCYKCNGTSACDECEKAYTKSGSICMPCTTGCLGCVEGKYLDSGTCKTCTGHCLKCKMLIIAKNVKTGGFYIITLVLNIHAKIHSAI